MGKDLIYSELYEVYKNLLTENQSEVFNLYYLCDLSLGEISEMKCVSRQSVSDTLSKTRDLLLGYELKLRLLEKKRNIVNLINQSNCDNKSELLTLVGDI